MLFFLALNVQPLFYSIEMLSLYVFLHLFFWGAGALSLTSKRKKENALNYHQFQTEYVNLFLIMQCIHTAVAAEIWIDIWKIKCISNIEHIFKWYSEWIILRRKSFASCKFMNYSIFKFHCDISHFITGIHILLNNHFSQFSFCLWPCSWK